MKNDDYRTRAHRAQRNERKKALAGNPSPRCSMCGEDRLALLQLDHAGGDANSELTNWLCHNCHALVSDGWYDAHPELLEHARASSSDSRLAALLQGVVIFLEGLIAKLKEWIAYLLGRDRGETREAPR